MSKPKSRAAASNYWRTDEIEKGVQPPPFKTPGTAGHCISQGDRRTVYTAMAESGAPIVVRRRPVPLPAVSAKPKERGLAIRSRNRAAIEADRRAVRAFYAARRAREAELADACSMLPEATWPMRICMKCGSDYGQSVGRSPCCSFITKLMTSGEMRRYREKLWLTRLEQVAANEVTR